MKVGEQAYQSIWLDTEDPSLVCYINQQLLPFDFRIGLLASAADAHRAIRDMEVRGAPLIGATAAFGIYLASLEAAREGRGPEHIREAAASLRKARPTAVNLAWSVDRMMEAIRGRDDMDELKEICRRESLSIVEEEKQASYLIGINGQQIIEKMYRRHQRQIHVLTHCNAGWLACIDYGTALAPVYLAHDGGIPVHVWVDETRPRNQGARLTAWELAQHGVPHTVIADNAGGLLMQRGEVDMVIVGSDRTTRTGDVANKIGTYLKALAARDNQVPFYVALPRSSIDLNITNGLRDIPIEERGEDELRFVEGLGDGRIRRVQVLPAESDVSNFGFDITPASFITALITEAGICEANEREITALFGRDL